MYTYFRSWYIVLFNHFDNAFFAGSVCINGIHVLMPILENISERKIIYTVVVGGKGISDDFVWHPFSKLT